VPLRERSPGQECGDVLLGDAAAVTLGVPTAVTDVQVVELSEEYATARRVPPRRRGAANEKHQRRDARSHLGDEAAERPSGKSTGCSPRHPGGRPARRWRARPCQCGCRGRAMLRPTGCRRPVDQLAPSNRRGTVKIVSGRSAGRQLSETWPSAFRIPWPPTPARPERVITIRTQTHRRVVVGSSPAVHACRSVGSSMRGYRYSVTRRSSRSRRSSSACSNSAAAVFSDS
jgi:hypothetical protein